uniref:Protein-glutamine gamma-glutamyltransferase 2 n=1 Tax=Nothobranchius furzeri TaxID=105023 RepID=A0A8C6NWD6_NOTFU
MTIWLEEFTQRLCGNIMVYLFPVLFGYCSWELACGGSNMHSFKDLNAFGSDRAGALKSTCSETPVSVLQRACKTSLNCFCIIRDNSAKTMGLVSTSNSVFKGVDLHSRTNNTEHHTSEISVDQLIVRRGQPFILTLKLAQPFNPDLDQLIMTAETGNYPSETRGTMSRFGVPNKVPASASSKAVWKAELQKGSSPETGSLTLTIKPPADAPIGEYKLSAKHKEEEQVLANLSVLFNPWCSDDWVFQPDDEQRQEYVMNEHGVIYRGVDNYISQMHWDFAQFEEDMVKICVKILDMNLKHKRDPAEDVSARCNPIYVSRVVTSMINNANFGGILQGSWGSDFRGGVPPSHWSGSYAILKQWYSSFYSSVKYGQCWVFAGVMCSVMRLLGIPCRVVTNYQSAHDTNRNLTVDTYFADYGVRAKESKDSVWNFHVWVEGWMRRPDLAKNNKYDGWQVLDPTPQEKSDGMFCCGPAPVTAILNGDTHLKYDVSFVFAEVNADCVCWLVKKDGTMDKISTDNITVGQNISTKSISSNKRMNITDSYKQREGTEQERSVFRYALDRLKSEATGEGDTGGSGEKVLSGTSEMNTTDPVRTAETNKPSQLIIQFKEDSRPVNGGDVNLKLILSSESTVTRLLSVNISIQAMRYTGQPAGNIQTEVTEQKLLPGQDLSIPILVPFLTYHKYMIVSQSLNVSVIITDLQNKENIYLAETRIKLMDPPISITVLGEAVVGRELTAEVMFMNPVKETLRNCTLTLSGSGLFTGEIITNLPDLQPSNRIRVQFPMFPYRSGERSLMVDFDCSSFRDIKASCTVYVK